MRTYQLSVAASVIVLMAACAPTEDVAPAASPALPFIADDYPTALAEARARDLPIFVESWAPW